jgi:SAM-dependent methyltransferase
MDPDVSSYLNKIIQSITQVSEELTPVLKDHSWDQVADIGCGSGIRTYALLSQIQSTTILGIDKDPQAIDIANRYKNVLSMLSKDIVRSIQLDDNFPESLFDMLKYSRFPNFLCADITVNSSSSLYSVPLDLAYCRRLLVNIYNEGGESSILAALSTISGDLRSGGMLLAVEETSVGDFSILIEKARFKRINVDDFFYSGGVLSYKRYIYIKQ